MPFSSRNEVALLYDRRCQRTPTPGGAREEGEGGGYKQARGSLVGQGRKEET